MSAAPLLAAYARTLTRVAVAPCPYCGHSPCIDPGKCGFLSIAPLNAKTCPHQGDCTARAGCNGDCA
jgi:hypothetical protein